MKVTEWFSITKHGHPAHEGWYDIRYDGRKDAYGLRRYWDGLRWRFGPGGIETAFGNEDPHGEYWRGLASKDGK